MNQVKISVVIPAYNSEKYLEKCLTAILDSNYQNFEVILVSDASNDQTVEIAKRHVDKILELKKCQDRLQVRMAGFQASSGEILVNVDSDVEIKKDTLQQIANYFNNHPDVGAMTGLLAKESSEANNFFSTYKNLYMNFKFSSLPTKITFLYGSIFALRRSAYIIAEQELAENSIQTGTDESELGQLLSLVGIQIGFDRSLEVYHNKLYSLTSLLRNDYIIPREFVRLFLYLRAKPTLKPGEPVFLHTQFSQVISIGLVYLSLCCLFFSLGLLSLMITCWIFSNSQFFYYIYKNKSSLFLLKSILFTFIDQFTMGIGMLAGLFRSFYPSRLQLPEQVIINQVWNKN